MAAYAKIAKREFNEIVADYGVPRVNAVREATDASLGHYLLETQKGKFLLRFETPRSEMEIKRELDFLIFLRKHGFPCFLPLADRRGRHYREWDGQTVALYKYADGHTVTPDEMSLGQVENVGRVLADLHLIGKSYKKGIDSRFAFERIAEVYRDARVRLPHYFKRIIRTLDEELEYLTHYLEAKLPKGVIHGDLFPDKLRFKGDKIIFITEFDAAARGKFIFDLANAVNLFCYADTRYHLKKFEALVGGYEALRTLSLAEWDAFPNELRFSAFRLAATHLHEFFYASLDERERVNRDFHDFYERLRILRREREGGMEPMLMAMATGYDYRKYQRVKAVEKRGSR
jgi:homoserine kinase type II